MIELFKVILEICYIYWRYGVKMKTTVYLIRHSIRFNKNYIEQYNTSQNTTIRNEKVVLSVEGEKRAEILSNVEDKDDMKFTFKDKVIFNKKINAPEVFKLEFDENNELIDIQNIEFDDLPYKDGMGK